jgi:hypothetical protein
LVFRTIKAPVTVFPFHAAGERSIRLAVNGSAVEDPGTTGAHPIEKSWVSRTWFRRLSAGDAVRLQAWQNSSTRLAVSRGDTALSLVKVS